MVIFIAIIIIAAALGALSAFAARLQETPERNPFHGEKNPLRFFDKNSEGNND